MSPSVNGRLTVCSNCHALLTKRAAMPQYGKKKNLIIFSSTKKLSDHLGIYHWDYEIFLIYPNVDPRLISGDFCPFFFS